MKAILHTKFGPPDELQIREIDKPVPKDNEVLIKIHATSVTSTDCNARNFTFVTNVFKLPARFMFGFFKPKVNILGIDLAGEIEATGKNVKRFKEGDKVFGTAGIAFGSHAEYTCMPEEGVLAIKPTDFTWEEAAAVFLGAHTALYFLRDKGNIQAGQKILIYGASGGVGTFAVQFARHFGANVTGVCSTKNLDMVRSLGANKVIDYTKEDFTKSDEMYDIIFDTIGKTSFSRCKRVLKDKGILLTALIGLPEIIQIIWTSVVGGRKVKGGVAAERIEDINFFKKLIETGRLKAIIDRCYPLEQAAEAFRYVEKGHKRGNVVINVSHEKKI